MFGRFIAAFLGLFGGGHPDASRNCSEERVRVMFTLPCRTDTEEPQAIREVVEYLREQQSRQIGLDGFTFSDVSQPVFQGYWWSDQLKDWIQDPIVMFIVDYLRPSTQQRFFIEDELSQLKQIVAEAYRRHDSEQEEVWIVFHDVLRQP